MASILIGIALPMTASLLLVLAACLISAASNLYLTVRRHVPLHLALSALLAFVVLLTWNIYHQDQPIGIMTVWLSRGGTVLAALGLLGILFSPRRLAVLGRIGRAGVPLIIATFFWIAVMYARTIDPRFPYATLSNNDIWAYLKFADLAKNGAAVANNIVGADLYKSMAYSQTPAAIFLLSILSSLFRASPAAVFGGAVASLMSASTCLVYMLCHNRFGMRRAHSALLSFAWSCSGTIYVVLGFGFLAQAAGIALTLLLIYVSTDRRSRLPYQMLSAALILFTLSLTYSLGFVAASVLYLVIVSTETLLAIRRDIVFPVIVRWVVLALAPVVGFGLLAAVDFWTAALKISELLYLAEVTSGWAYGMLNPAFFVAAMMPIDVQNISVAVAIYAAIATVGLFMLARALFYRREGNGATRLSFLSLTCALTAGLTVYVAYYLVHGAPSYNQWKLAISLVAPVSFMLLAVPLYLVTQGNTVVLRMLSTVTALALFGLGMVNLSTMSKIDASRLTSFEKYAAIDRAMRSRVVRGAGPIHLDFGTDFEATMVAVQAIRTSPIFLYSPSYYMPAKRRHQLDSVGGVVVTNRCDRFIPASVRFVGGDICVGVAPALRDYGEVPIDRLEQAGISTTGISGNELWGRWTDGRVATLQFEVDPNWSALEFEMDVLPFTSRCVSKQSVTLAVAGEVLQKWEVSQAEMLSVQVPRRLLVDGLAKVDLLLPDAASPKSCELSEDTRALGLGITGLRIIHEK